MRTQEEIEFLTLVDMHNMTIEDIQRWTEREIAHLNGYQMWALPADAKEWLDPMLTAIQRAQMAKAEEANYRPWEAA